MARFVYYWKSADNARHEGEIEASSRDEAFALLRGRGIRAIKVEPKGWETGEGYGGVRKRAVAALVVLAAAAAAAVTLWLGGGRRPKAPEPRLPQMKSGGAYAIAYRQLVAKASAMRKLHEGEIGTLDLDALRDYGRLARATNGLAGFEDVICAAHRAVERARERTKALFRDIYSTFPPDCAGERIGAQKLYGELMTEIDANEERINADEAMLRLLDSSRTGWRAAGGGIRFLDKGLEREFSFLMQDAGIEGLRWQQDFKAQRKAEIISDHGAKSPSAPKSRFHLAVEPSVGLE